MPSLPSNITRECPPSLLTSQGTALPLAGGSTCPASLLKPLTPAEVTCESPHPPAPTPGHNNSNSSTCAHDSQRGELIPWVTSVNVSNVYGDCGPEGGPTTPLLGIFSTARECQAACEANPNCTQYGWLSSGPAAGASAQWTHRCFGRCDTSWKPHSVNGTVWGRRVHVQTDDENASNENTRPKAALVRLKIKTDDQAAAVRMDSYPPF